MKATSTYVILGANLAGGRAAEVRRINGCDGRIVRIGAEPERPYERPSLSKQYLRREWPREQILLHAAGYDDLHDSEPRLGRRACHPSNNPGAVLAGRVNRSRDLAAAQQLIRAATPVNARPPTRCST